MLQRRQKDIDLFESLAAFNDTAGRFVPFYEQTLKINPASPGFAGEFVAACERWVDHERRS